MGSAKWLTWFTWIVNLVISGVYCTAAIWTFRILLKDTTSASWAARDGLLAACLIGTAVVAFWVITSFLVLLSHGWGKSPLGYGFMLGSALHTGIFQLLAALMLNASRTWASSLTSKAAFSVIDYDVYCATFFLSYVLCATYLSLFCILLFARKHLAGDDSCEEKPLRTNMYQNTMQAGDSVTSQKKAGKSGGSFQLSAPPQAAASTPLPFSHEPLARTSLQYGGGQSYTTKGAGVGPSKYGAFNV